MDQDNGIIDDFLDFDIPGLLCDVMNNHNPPLIGKVFICLLKLCQSKKFEEQKHSAIVMETSCRTLIILSKDATNMKTMYLGLQLINKVLSSADKETAVNLPLLLRLVKTLLFSPMYQPVHMSAIYLLRMLLKLNKQFLAEDLERVLRVVYQTLGLFSQLNNNNKGKLNKNISLVTEILTSSMRLCDLFKTHNLSHDISQLVWELLQSYLVPCFQ
ncbi:hypothetical protein J6590_105768, partial [Homalodisca vitripennis]